MIYGAWSKRRNSIGMVILLGFMLILGLPACAEAAPVGKVTYLEGNVDVTPTDGRAQALKLHDPVNLGDILRTKSRSRVEVTFSDGNVLRLAESTRLRVTQYAPGENQKSYMNLFRGKTQSIVGALKKGSQYEIHTPTAICGVRGTNFFSFFINGVSGSVFQEGSGYGYNPNFPQDVKQIAAGEAILVTHENAPPVVRPATAIELEKHLKDTAPAQDKKDEDKKDPAPPPGSGTPQIQPPEPAPPGSPLGSNPVPPYQPPVLIPPPTPTPTPTPEPTPAPTSGVIGIQSATVTGASFSLAGTLTSPTAPSAGQLSNVVLGEGASFNGYVAGVPGSWNGAIRGIYRDGSDNIGLVSGTLTGAITGTTLSASGPIVVGGIFGAVSNSDYPPGSSMSPFAFPVYQFKTIAGGLYTYEPEPDATLTGYQTTNGGILAVWGVANTGTYSNPGHATLSADQWATYAWGARILHSTGISLTDDSSGHTALTGEFRYMDTRYRGVAGLHYFGSYDAGGVYKTAGAGYYALRKLAFTGEAGSNVVNYVYANNNGAWAAAGKISFLLGTDALPWSSCSTTLYHGGDVNISQAYSAYSRFLWNAPVKGYDIVKGSIGDAYNNGLGGGYINGFSGGILTGTAGAKSGVLAALYLSTDRAQAGWLTGPVASTDPGAWMGEGTLTTTVPGTQFGELLTTDKVSVELGSLTGKMSGNVGTVGTMAGNVPASGGMIAYFTKTAQSGSSWSLPWGIYNIKFGGNFAGKPAGDTTWTATAGGAGSDFGSYGGRGYWLGTVAGGTWSAAGELGGSFSGRFLTDRTMGTSQGPFFGINTGAGQTGSWIGQSIGTYTGTPLQFSSAIEARKISGGSVVLNTFNIPTTGSGRWWQVGVIETQDGVSRLYRINTIDASDDPASSYYTRTLIGPITTPVYFRLTWGASPDDLDSHAWIPGSGHVYYRNRGDYSAYPWAYLDQDITAGYGPEVLSFSQFLAGDTFYSVYNFSGTDGFTTSGASVEILYGTPDITPIFDAYFGGTASLFTSGTNQTPVAMMGQFRSVSSTGALWHAPLYSYDSLTYTDRTYDGGAYRGYLVGTKTGNAMSALMYALYVAPQSGSTGYLKGGMTGTADPGVMMFSMEGSLGRTQMTGAVALPPGDLYIYSGTGSGSLAAALGTGGFSGAGQLTMDTQAIRIADTTQPWGIYKFTDWGGFTNPASAATTWTGKAGGSGVFGAYYVSAMVDDAGYWLADLSGGWTGGKITGSLQNGTFLTEKKWGTLSGDVLGVYNDSNQTWQAASVGAWDGRDKTLAFSSKLAGDLYQVVGGKIVSGEYQRPYYLNASTSYSRFDPLTYEVIYFMKKNADGSYSSVAQPQVFGFEQIQRVGGAPQSEFTYKDEYHYYPVNRWLVLQKGNGVTRATGSGRTNSLVPVPVLSAAPPVTPFFDTAKIVANTTPGTTTFAYDKYVKSFESAWMDTNAAVWNGSFNGILGGLPGESLWTPDSGAKTGLLLMGTHDAYVGSQIFDTAMSYSLTGAGAFAGNVTGIIRDTGPTGENPLEGLAIGIYVDSAGKAGILKGNLAGVSHQGINMWETTTATLYRDDTLRNFSTSVTPTGLLATDAGGGYTNLFRGAVGAGVNSGIYGTFGDSGYIKSAVGISGHTLSLVDRPHWGYFDVKIGATNTYAKPAGSSAWTATLFSSGMFGKYGNYADTGYWYAGLTSGAWADNRLSGVLAGEFLTFKKKGTVEGLLLGTYDGATSGAWQATSVGTWQKTQDVYFSSEIWGKSYTLVQEKQGSKSYGDGGYYNYSYNDQGEKRYGAGEYYYYDATAGRNKKVITRFDIQGPPAGEKGHKDVWVQNYGADGTANTADDTWTFQTTVYAEPDDYKAAMTDLRKDPADPSQTVAPADQRDFHTSGFSGIMAGLGNLWANMGTVTPSLGNPYTSAPTSLFLMGDGNIFEQQTFNLFAGKAVSFDPLLTMNPFSDSRTPAVAAGENTNYRGAYYGFLGGAVNSANNTSGFFRAMYMDQNRNVGLIYSDAPLAGTFDPNVGMWKAGGEVYAYQMFPYALVTTGVNPQNFAASISNWSYGFKGQKIIAGNVTGADDPYIDMQVADSSTISLNNMLSSGSLTLVQAALGGSYRGIPDNWSWTINPPVGGYVPEETQYKTVKITRQLPTDNTFTGSTAGAEIDWTYAQTKVTGGEIRGLFDPTASTSTWKAVAVETTMRTQDFLAKVSGMTTDEQRLAFQKATNIPAFQVGQANLAGTQNFGDGNTMSVMMSNVTFFAPSAGGPAGIWASAPTTGGVTGNYTGTPAAGGTVPLIQQGASQNVSYLNANFQINNWNTNNNAKWGATVNGGGTVNSQSIGFTGGAAGTIAPAGGTFSGAAAGIVTPPQQGGY